MARGLVLLHLWCGLALAGCGASKSGGTPSSSAGGTPGTNGSTGGTTGWAGATGTAGGGGAGTAGGAPVVVQPEPDLTGTWALFGFEDPVAVQLSQRDGVLTGLGCYAGLPQPERFLPGMCSEILSGTIVNGRARFAFRAESYVYAADVFVSAGADRMTGLFHGTTAWHGPMGWLRIPPSSPWLSSADVNEALRAAVKDRQQSYDLRLAGAGAPVGPEFARDRIYRLAVRAHGGAPIITGDLGVFWHTEMSWQEQSQTLLTGPVPVTAADLPVSLTLSFEGPALTSVDATTPSGARHRFDATPQVLP